ncbi:MAG: nucleotidyl transferase AbiEii/AbiGii toxin family protein [Candidatus Eisenbacteria bacterium]
MHDAIGNMLQRYECRTREDYTRALREILQTLALLGLWRSKFFEKAAFYGGTASRLLYGLDRYSEDLDFSLLRTDDAFSLGAYGSALCREIRSFGFEVDFEDRGMSRASAMDSVFLKANTYQQLITIGVAEGLLRGLHHSKTLKIRLQIDIDPPAGFETETEYVLQPVPFPLRVYSLPDLFAGKLHAVLCRRWKTRVKGRDWYDLVWFAGRDAQVRLTHLESRMRQSGDYTDDEPLSREKLQTFLGRAVEELDVEQARREVAPFVRDQRALEVWSKDFFSRIMMRIEPI